MRSVTWSIVALVLVASPLQAQTLREAVTDLFKFGQGCPDPVCLSVATGVHGAHFNPAASGAQGNLITFLTQSIGASASEIPISAATSTALLIQSSEGLPVRVPTSAGPIFAERVQTIGKGRLFFSASVTNFDFATLRGVPLSGLQTTFTHQDTGAPGLGNPIFENDVIEVATSMHINMLAVTGSLTYGLGRHVDIGVAVPVLNSSLSGSSFAQIMPFGPNGPHFFGDSTRPTLDATSNVRTSAFGIGDIATRLKIGLVNGEQWGFGILGDVRLPTGRTADFQGSGKVGVRGLGIVSARFDRFSPHLNAGYYFHAGSEQNDAALVTLGFDQMMAPWATFAADVISEWQVGQSVFVLPQDVILTSPIGTGFTTRTITPTNIPDRRDDVVLGSFGFKFTTGGGLTLISNALVPIHRGAVQPNLAFSGGLEYTF
jgi:hypothetical protein